MKRTVELVPTIEEAPELLMDLAELLEHHLKNKTAPPPAVSTDLADELDDTRAKLDEVLKIAEERRIKLDVALKDAAGLRDSLKRMNDNSLEVNRMCESLRKEVRDLRQQLDKATQNRAPSPAAPKPAAGLTFTEQIIKHAYAMHPKPITYETLRVAVPGLKTQSASSLISTLCAKGMLRNLGRGQFGPPAHGNNGDWLPIVGTVVELVNKGERQRGTGTVKGVNAEKKLVLVHPTNHSEHIWVPISDLAQIAGKTVVQEAAH